MFTQKKDTGKLNIDQTVNRISSGTMVKGDITSETDLRIDGKVKGNVTSKAKVIIGANGELIGELVCSEAAVEGKVKGNVSVNGLLKINATARIEGEVHYKKIVVEEGAVIIGPLITHSAISVHINLDESKKESKGLVSKKIG